MPRPAMLRAAGRSPSDCTERGAVATHATSGNSGRKREGFESGHREKRAEVWTKSQYCSKAKKLATLAPMLKPLIR
eukprot:3248313-Pleurochrysis_carterae.AAC.1